MKKICSIFLVAMVALFWGACSSDDDDDQVAGAGGFVVAGGSAVVGTGGTPAVTSGTGGGVEPPADSGAPDGSATVGATGGTDVATGGTDVATGGTDVTTGGTGGTIDASVDTGVTATGGTEGGSEAAVTDAVVTEGGTGFEACIASLDPLCVIAEIDTEAKMEEERGCASMQLIPIPTSDGGQYGPITIQAGPYGGRIHWNEGAGSGFENNISASEPSCLPGGIEAFAEPASTNAEMLNTRGLKYELYTIFAPACMKEGEKYPVITWANGTCGLTHGYVGLLASEASHGFVVVATNSTWTGTTTAPDGTPVQRNALNYAEYLNDDPNSVFYQKLDMENVGAAGHSQGAGATRSSASDPRIDAVILWNGGVSNDKPFIYVSGDRDLGGSPSSLASSTNGARQPGAWVYFHQVLETGGRATGHLVLMEQPARVIDMSIAWWKWQLKGDQEAKNMFIGDSCGLCNRDAEFEYGHNSLLQ